MNAQTIVWALKNAIFCAQTIVIAIKYTISMQELYFEQQNLSNTYAITKIPAYKNDLDVQMKY